MKRITKLLCVFSLLIGLAVCSVAAASITVPHDGSWYYVSGAKAKAYDSQANTVISYGTTGVVTSTNYGMTIGIYRNGDNYPLSTNNSYTLGKEIYANFYTNTAAGHISHYHKLFAAIATR